jgi:hypothetical protein
MNRLFFQITKVDDIWLWLSKRFVPALKLDYLYNGSKANIAVYTTDLSLGHNNNRICNKNNKKKNKNNKKK